MPAAALEKFPHVANMHCSSTSVQDVLRFDGQVFSEAMVFGLGSGLGFFYVNDGQYSPTRRFNGRAMDLEGKFYRLLGAPLEWRGHWDAVWITETLMQQRPLLAQTDIAYLPHYQDDNGQGAHFPLHGVVVTGIDADAQQVFVADTFAPEPLAVSFDNFKAALIGEGSPLMRPFSIAAAPYVELAVTEKLIAQSIRVVIEEMFNPDRRALGIPAMRRLAEDFKRWQSAEDWVWCARFAYQGIEKRGTGGGAFRQMYADFLREASHWVPALETFDAEPRMRESGARWTELASLCRTAFIAKNPAALMQAGTVVAAIVRIEEALLRDMADAVRPLL